MFGYVFKKTTWFTEACKNICKSVQFTAKHGAVFEKNTQEENHI